MTEPLTAAARPADFGVTPEVPVAGAVPRFELAGWREEYRVAAGITGRGTGPEPFDLGLWSATPAGRAMERWRSFKGAFPGFRSAVLGMQVHGTKLRWHDPAEGWLIVDGVDGHGTDHPGVLLTVTVADCVPVYLADPDHRRVALLHAGWRGVAAGILASGVDLLRSRGSPATSLAMHCGVAICGRCYEVGSEVFEACGLPAPGGGAGPLDLRALLASQAGALGIRNVSISAFCSAHDSAKFFSHRASAGADGRMVAYLGLLP